MPKKKALSVPAEVHRMLKKMECLTRTGTDFCIKYPPHFLEKQMKEPIELEEAEGPPVASVWTGKKA